MNVWVIKNSEGDACALILEEKHVLLLYLGAKNQFRVPSIHFHMKNFGIALYS